MYPPERALRHIIPSGEGFVVVTVSNIFLPSFMNDSIIGSNFVVPEMTGAVGEVTITTT